MKTNLSPRDVLAYHMIDVNGAGSGIRARDLSIMSRTLQPG
jgi:hypothetical protein